MSIKLMNYAWGVKLNPTDKLVLIALADNASDEGVCWPSVKTLCKKTGLSRRGLQASVARLVNDGTLERTFRNGHSTSYLIRIINGLTCAPDAPPPAHLTRPPCARRAPPPAHVTRPEPSIEPSIEPAKKFVNMLSKEEKAIEATNIHNLVRQALMECSMP